MKKYLLALLIAVLAILVLAAPVFAYIATPDSTPIIQEIHVYRNALETGDMFIFFKEKTPYAATPGDGYSKTFVWQLYDPTDTFEIARAVGYDYNDNGYNENIIGLYFSASEAPTWGATYYLKLTGTPIGFASPPVYQFPIEAGDYSSLTNQTDVLEAISNQVIEWADQLNSDWGLVTTAYLTMSGETGTVLSFDGQDFFRGAVYGIQSLAPYAFDVQITNIGDVDRTWTTGYTSNLTASMNGTYIGDAADAGNDMLGITGYNLFGLLGLLAMCGLFIGCCIYIGGDIWGSLVMAAGCLVIGGRMAMIGLGELGLVAALMWLWISAKVWKLV